MGAISNLFTFFNGLFENWDLFVCCQSLQPWDCLTRFLPLIQLSWAASHWSFILFLYTLFLDPKASLKHKCVSQITFLFYVSVCLLGGGSLTLIVNVEQSPHSTVAEVIGFVLGVIASVTIAIQYLPQLWVTWNLKKRGTLSLITLLLTASGALLTAFSMAIFFDQSIWIWLPNLISGIEQLVLFVMCIVFVCHEWRETKTERPEKEKLLTAKNRTK